VPQLPEPPAPAECTRAAFEAFAPELSGLPAGFQRLSPDERARTLLYLKNEDAQRYLTLREQALRCAR
jgi:hypothetical protein